MSTEEKRWQLYCASTQERVRDQTEAEVLTKVKTLTDTEWKNWFVWTPGYADWIPLVDCLLFKNSRDRRRFPRVELRVVVIIQSGFQKFQTFTKDISEGGLLLDRPVPFIPPSEKCRVTLRYADIVGEPLVFNARLIMDSQNPRRVEFLSAEDKFKKRLKNWVDRALANKKPEKKTA